MIKYTLKFKRKKFHEHAMAINYAIDVPGFSASTRDHLVHMIEMAIRPEAQRINDFLFEDEKTFKEKVKEVEASCKKIAEKVLAEKDRVDELKRKIGLPIEEQKIEPKRKNSTSKKT